MHMIIISTVDDDDIPPEVNEADDSSTYFIYHGSFFGIVGWDKDEGFKLVKEVDEIGFGDLKIKRLRNPFAQLLYDYKIWDYNIDALMREIRSYLTQDEAEDEDEDEDNVDALLDSLYVIDIARQNEDYCVNMGMAVVEEFESALTTRSIEAEEAEDETMKNLCSEWQERLSSIQDK